MNKYRNKIIKVDGETFHSMKEATRWQELEALEKAGDISNLQRQVKYVLIPSQREPDRIGKRGGIIQGKVIEREVAYFADFVYEKPEDVLYHECTKGGVLSRYGSAGLVVEDTKGVRTTDYIIKRKLMLYLYGIRIKEI